MKTVTVKGLSIQFDTSDEGADQHNAHDMVDEINVVLQRYLPFKQPQIIKSSVDADNIEITPMEESEE